MDLDQRKRWDQQIDQVYEIHPLRDLDSANIALGFGKYGDCVRAGIGYCKTKANLGISPREQLTLCGIQNFDCGSSIIWGAEMEECHDNLSQVALVLDHVDPHRSKLVRRGIRIAARNRGCLAHVVDHSYYV